MKNKICGYIKSMYTQAFPGSLKEISCGAVTLSLSISLSPTLSHSAAAAIAKRRRQRQCLRRRRRRRQVAGQFLWVH